MNDNCYKGIFWYYNFGNNALKRSLHSCFFFKKILCDKNGKPINSEETQFEDDGLFDYETYWKECSIMSGIKPFNAYPRGRVTVKDHKAYVYLTPDIAIDEIKSMISELFCLTEDMEPIFVPDGSKEYACVFEENTVCSFCGKPFSYWDYEEDFHYSHQTPSFSKYQNQEIELNLCCDCAKALINFIRSQDRTK